MSEDKLKSLRKEIKPSVRTKWIKERGKELKKERRTVPEETLGKKQHRCV